MRSIRRRTCACWTVAAQFARRGFAAGKEKRDALAKGPFEQKGGAGDRRWRRVRTHPSRRRRHHHRNHHRDDLSLDTRDHLRVAYRQWRHGSPGTPAQTTQADVSDPQVQFVSKVLGSTEDVWATYFQQAGKQYVDPKLTLFHGRVGTACGGASAAVGPFYCPGDKRV